MNLYNLLKMLLFFYHNTFHDEFKGEWGEYYIYSLVFISHVFRTSNTLIFVYSFEIPEKGDAYFLIDSFSKYEYNDYKEI